MEVTPGNVEACLVPVASLLNHSAHPHIRNFGRMNPETHTMDFCVDRPCSAGQEVLLSYGRLPNHSLLLYYGFALKNNPHDSLPMTLEVHHCSSCLCGSSALNTGCTATSANQQSLHFQAQPHCVPGKGSCPWQCDYALKFMRQHAMLPAD